jgi:hypothetical protein
MSGEHVRERPHAQRGVCGIKHPRRCRPEIFLAGPLKRAPGGLKQHLRRVTDFSTPFRGTMPVAQLCSRLAEARDQRLTTVSW